MGSGVIVTLIVLIVVLVLGISLLLFNGRAGSKNSNTSLRNLVLAQKSSQLSDQQKSLKSKNSSLAYVAAEESGLSNHKKEKNSNKTLKRQLQYACWNITPMQYRLIKTLITLTILIPAYFKLTTVLFVVIAILIPLLVDSFLDRAVNARFELFDKDYPVLLLSYVSLLKTGMNAIQGLDEAAKGLDEESLVRAEVELLVERLRLGLSEDQAINAFAEDIPHPELELFVQSLILSRKVGGGLSKTLERLSKQVRKRQQFRKQAVAVVGMEKSSSYMIAAIMTALLIYLSITAPDLIVPAMSHPQGKKYVQGGLALIFLGFYWSKKVTNIKI